jgi:acyl dehydratase
MHNGNGRELADTLHDFNALRDGDWVRTAELTITADHIDRFAELTGDRFEIHMSDAKARAHGFRGRVAHGLLILSLVDGLKNQAAARFDAVASLGWDWSFKRPVLIGDSIRATLSVAEKRQTRHADKGIIRLRCDVVNQNGETVQTGSNQLMMYRRD